MKTAQKKPVIVEFIQLTESNIAEVYLQLYPEDRFSIPSCKVGQDKWDDYEQIVKREGLKLKTPESGEGTQIAGIGDYIIFGYSEKLGRHCWPVKSDYFKSAYDVLP